ncbi:hypothetical protein V496_05914 [Pseudogymnoascus sp. VKM F-4515 (FW-2607)]|nr:hypothetical protein V496_05914 [Pseudogymnoascus sp. VKM F-4515 (FW-2607)]
MKSSLLLSLVALVRLATCNGPHLSFDPTTASDCVEFYDNVEGETCEEVLDYWNITPEEFHKWNPSVGLDCKPWELQSYCIVTEEKLDNKIKTATTSSATTKTTISSSNTSSPTPDLSPTVWIAKGCYADDIGFPILEENVSPLGGYTDLTIHDGNQCWCSNYLEAFRAENQTDCNARCTGDKEKYCGGKGVLNVSRAEENEEPRSTAVTTYSVTPSAMTSGAGSAAETVLSSTQSSGTRRHRAIF